MKPRIVPRTPASSLVHQPSPSRCCESAVVISSVMALSPAAAGNRRVGLLVKPEITPPQILHQPRDGTAGPLAFLTGPTSTTANAERSETDFVQATRNMGLQSVVLKADTEQKIDEAFASMVQQRVAGLVVENDAFLNSRREQITALAARHRVPAIYAYREHIQAGGLISYGTDVNEMYRQAGIYTGRILKGEKPGDLPVQLPVKFELLIN